jgi:adenylyl-sulfate kinase
VVEKYFMNKGHAIWFTGLSGSGKSTLAKLLEQEIVSRDFRVRAFDGDELRRKLSPELGFSREDIKENNMRIASYVNLQLSEIDFALVSVISPFVDDREKTRNKLGSRYIEVFVDTPLSVCMARDVKGLYRKAQAGEIKYMIGVHPDVPYEPPTKPEIHIQTECISTEESIDKILLYLQSIRLV